MTAALLAAVVAILLFKYRQLHEAYDEEQEKVADLVDRLSDSEHELIDVKARRKKLLAASTQALIIVEDDFSVSSANKVARRLFGKPGKSTTLIAWTRQHQLHDLVVRTLEGERMPPIFFSYQDKMLEAHARAIKEQKEPVAVALAIHDITKVEQLSRARRDFVANISHELRTPLASIQLLTDTLLDGGLDDRVMAGELVTKVATQVETLSQLAQEVLDLSLIESGKMPLKMSMCPLRKIVEQQTGRFQLQAHRKQLVLNIEVNDEVEVLVDSTLIGRVISNLLHNAIKFTERGSITISADRLNGEVPDSQPEVGDWVKVTIADTGIGISPEELPRIFERFYKIDRARSRQESGTGLGLAIARHIIEAHGGKIWAEQNNPGAIFHFTVPTE